jgi:uncharacterized membrane protein
MYKDYLEKNHSFDKKTMLGIFCMIIVIGGVFGFLYEYFFYFFNGGMKEFYYRGGNFLPWINIYATGSVMIYILTYKYRKNPLKVFLISAISTGLLEYFSGLGIYIIGDGLRYWDYNTEILNFGNINGFVCLRSVMFFGLSALLLMYVIVPFCFHVASKSNKKVFLIVTISICSIFLADEFYNLIFTRIFNLPNAIKIYKSLGVNYM